MADYSELCPVCYCYVFSHEGDQVAVCGSRTSRAPFTMWFCTVTHGCPYKRGRDDEQAVG